MSGIDEIIHNLNRNPFFLSSGFYPQEIINILEYKSDNKERLDKIKERKRAEQKLHKQAKIQNKRKHSKKPIEDFQIEKKKVGEEDLIPDKQVQRGLDLAAKWGWDGFNKTYHPILMKVYGSGKRRNQ